MARLLHDALDGVFLATWCHVQHHVSEQGGFLKQEKGHEQNREGGHSQVAEGRQDAPKQRRGIFHAHPLRGLVGQIGAVCLARATQVNPGGVVVNLMQGGVPAVGQLFRIQRGEGIQLGLDQRGKQHHKRGHRQDDGYQADTRTKGVSQGP